jgi:hypothetical protein
MHFFCYSRLALGVALPAMAVYLTPKDDMAREHLPKTPEQTQPK